MTTSSQQDPGLGASTDEEATLEYDLKLTGAGISIARKISQDVALQIIAAIMGGVPPSHVAQTHAPQQVVPEAKPATGRTVAIREFLNQSGAKRNPDKITAIAIYLRSHLNRETFSRDDIKGWFRKAGEPVPANYSRDFSAALSTGWIAEDHTTSGEYYVTNSGLQAMESGFQTKLTSTNRRRKRTGQRNGASE